MKSDLTKVSLALLSAVFILGCQDLGTGAVGPDGLEPQFAKGGIKGPPDGGGGGGGGKENPGSPFYEYTFSGGDITTEPTVAGASQGSGGVWLHQCCGEAGDGIDDELLTLSSTLLANFGSTSEVIACFGGIFPLTEYVADLRSDRGTVSGVHAVFHFKARDKTGTEARYILRFIGSVADSNDDDDGLFPPEDGETATVTFSEGRIRGGKKTNQNVCVGDVDMDVVVRFSVELTGRLDDFDLEL